jgi:hypothetical protein
MNKDFEGAIDQSKARQACGGGLSGAWRGGRCDLLPDRQVTGRRRLTRETVSREPAEPAQVLGQAGKVEEQWNSGIRAG